MKNIVLALKCLGMWILVFALSVSIASFLPSCGSDAEYPSPTVSGVLKGAERPSYIPFSDYTGDNPVITTEEYVNNRIGSGQFNPDTALATNVVSISFNNTKWIRIDSIVTVTGYFNAGLSDYDHAGQFQYRMPDSLLNSISDISGTISGMDNSFTSPITGTISGYSEVVFRWNSQHTTSSDMCYQFTFKIE